MAENYVSRYGLAFNPFIKNSKEIIVNNSEYAEVCGRLDYLLSVRGFGLLIGSPGQGKTTAVRNWLNSLNTSLYKPIYTCLSTVTVMEFYRNLVSFFDQEPAFRKVDNFKILQNEITRFSEEKRITPVIVIDEVNYISNAILNDLKIIFNFDMDSKDRAVVLLTGLNQIRNSLNLACNEPLRQRIVMNYDMSELTKEESRNYILKKLEGADCHQNVFDEASIEAIVNSANGIPRVINKLCNTCLLIGNSSNSNIITAEITMRAINDCSIR